MTKQVTIKIETSSLLILRNLGPRAAYCPTCRCVVEMIALEDTNANSSLDRAALAEWLKSEELHRSESPDGSSLICLNSLLARAQNTNAGNCGIPRLPNTKKERT